MSMKNKSNPFLRSALLAASIVFTIGQAAPAASATWNGTTDAVWATATNWSANPIPGTGDTATFDHAGLARVVISLGTGVTVQNLIFNTSLAAAYIQAISATPPWARWAWTYRTFRTPDAVTADPSDFIRAKAE